MNVDDAIEDGAMALFGEKYGDEVRVVSMGKNSDGAAKPVYSLELCGGTHVGRTGDIGLIKVLNESAVAAGVRRIEALAGEAAREYLDRQDVRVREAAELLKTTPGELTGRLSALVEERKTLERQLAEAKKQLAMGGGSNAGGDDGVSEIAGMKVMARVINGISPKDLRGIVDDGKTRLGSGIVAIVGVSEEGKAGISVGVTQDLTDKFSAVDLVRIGAAALGGKGGGGRPDMAQAGGPDGEKGEAALDEIRAAIAGS